MATKDVTDDFNLTNKSTDIELTFLRRPQQLWGLLWDGPTGYCKCINLVCRPLTLLYGTEVATKVSDLMHLFLDPYNVD